MLKRPSNLLFATSLCLSSLFAGSAIAIEHDFNQPIKVRSQFTSGDGIEKSLLYWGNVRIAQGSLLIEADEVEVQAKEGSGKEVFIARGKPAVYQQTKEDGTIVKAQANEIRYMVVNRTLSMEGEAELKQNSSMVKGSSITFDMLREQVNAAGSDDQDGRVITIFQPAAPTPKEQENNDGNP